MKTILICGGTGFIGRNIAEYFAADKDVKVYATYYKSKPYKNDNIEFIYADLTDAKQVNEIIKGKDIVIQAAATTSGSKEIISMPYYHVTDNAVMNSLILRSIFENKVKHFIFFSCSVMYQPSEVPVTEMDFDASKEIFRSYFGVGWTKVYIEKMCEFYSRICDTKFSVLRHSNIYGPYDKYDLERSHVFGATVTKVLTCKEGEAVTVWGEGKEKRDLLYVEDLVKAVEQCISRQENKYELLNIGYGKAISVSDLVMLIIKESKRKISVEYDISKPTIPTELSLDCQKAKGILGWAPEVSLEEGVRRTIKWYKENVLKEERNDN